MRADRPRPARRPRRRLWPVLAALCAALLLADAGYWFYVTRLLATGFAAWQAQARAAGWTVRAGPARIGGWPQAATLTVAGIALSGGQADVPGGLDWGAQQLALRVNLWRPQRLILLASGPQHLRLGTAPKLDYVSRHMQADLPLAAQAKGPVATLHAQDVRVALSPGAGGVLAIGRLHCHLTLRPQAPVGDAAAAFTLHARSIALPSGERWPLGPDIASLRLDGALEGPLPDTPGLAARATAWRDHGGAFRLRQVTLQWGPLDLSGTASLGLDPHLQPQGTGAVRVVGYAATLDALAAGGVLPHSAAVAAKAVLSLMAHTPQGGGPAEVDVPLSLQQGVLSMQSVPLLRIPPLDWQDGQG